MNEADAVVLFTGGGSGGHVYPLLAVAEELQGLAKEQKIDLGLHYIGPRDEYAEVLRAAGLEVTGIFAGKFRRYLSLVNLLDVPKFFLGLLVALFKVFWIMPDVIFSKGGTGALPVVLAGKFYMIPTIIHESDAQPGLTNLLSSRFASRIAVSFERALNFFPPKKVAWIGTPIRKDLLLDRPSIESAKEDLGFNPKASLVLILGGSQGSARINEFILSNFEGLLKITQVLHQTGQANFHEVEQLSHAALNSMPAQVVAKTRYRPVANLDKVSVKMAFSAADLIVARAGSGIIAEAASFGKPMILIPLRESAGDHQKINAYELVKTGAAIVIEETNLFPGIFFAQIKSILDDPSRTNKMSIASQNFFKPGAAQLIAQEILKLAQ